MTSQSSRKGLIARLEPDWKIESDPPEIADDPANVETLIDQFHAAHVTGRMSAAVALVEIGAAAVVPLIGELRSQNRVIWTLAAATLVKIGDAAVEPLLRVLQAKREPEAVQILAVEILGQIGDMRAADVLIQTLESESSPLQTVAAIALARMGAAAVPALLAAAGDVGSGMIRQYAIEILKQLGTAAVRPLLAAMRGGSQMASSQAAGILAGMGDAAVPGLLEALGDANAHVRYSAAWALGMTGSEEVVPALIERLADTDRSASTRLRVCDAAASALQRIGTPEAARAAEAWQAIEDALGG